ncbi:type III secretion system chaperone [Ramlibacter rhizophilus]|uniref:CesT family type III secretion system chaperone n=1 Tax=Ramlibacter rhizophilus TaxID=1781167 RepID=A0A4Z0BZ66_9BURK|nr:type III secretion system chaperone [Ramlibacter rhizophilus]TFZ03249.1 CesT family type III secretion system chaperone [Ramlibacter rhizophilus]
MDKRQLAEKLISKFGTLLTLPELRLDDHSNSCVLLFDGDIVLNIEFDEPTGQLILSTYLDELPVDSPEAILRELMVANLYWHRTDGATLGLEDATNGVILAQARMVTELDDASFEKMVETFVNQAERWKKRLGEAKTSVNAAAPMAQLPHLAEGPRIFG